ncbi:MAG: hypothetical protein H6868_07695 [Rhodospirillales bacterium]|nr:hypothetical protein [Rhodospirillales bacterium]
MTALAVDFKYLAAPQGESLDSLLGPTGIVASLGRKADNVAASIKRRVNLSKLLTRENGKKAAWMVLKSTAVATVGPMLAGGVIGIIGVAATVGTVGAVRSYMEERHKGKGPALKTAAKKFLKDGAMSALFGSLMIAGGALIPEPVLEKAKDLALRAVGTALEFAVPPVEAHPYDDYMRLMGEDSFSTPEPAPPPVEVPEAVPVEPSAIDTPVEKPAPQKQEFQGRTRLVDAGPEIDAGDLPVELPSAEDQFRAHIAGADNVSPKVTAALDHIHSDNANIRAQAYKDLSYFAAGRDGVMADPGLAKAMLTEAYEQGATSAGVQRQILADMKFYGLTPEMIAQQAEEKVAAVAEKVVADSAALPAAMPEPVAEKAPSALKKGWQCMISVFETKESYVDWGNDDSGFPRYAERAHEHINMACDEHVTEDGVGKITKWFNAAREKVLESGQQLFRGNYGFEMRSDGKVAFGTTPPGFNPFG